MCTKWLSRQFRVCLNFRGACFLKKPVTVVDLNIWFKCICSYSAPFVTFYRHDHDLRTRFLVLLRLRSSIFTSCRIRGWFWGFVEILPPSSSGEFISAESSINLKQNPLLHDVETQTPLIWWPAYITFHRYGEAVLRICCSYSVSFVACQKYYGTQLSSAGDLLNAESGWW